MRAGIAAIALACAAGCKDAPGASADADAHACLAVTACAAGDGCCPAGCTPNSDGDCSTTCGNGTLEGNETCDPQASCPSACNDGNACTSDVLIGGAANCNAECTATAITACAGGDGCCPAGCSDANDSDCVAASAPLADRLVVATITAPAGVIPGVSSWRIWGASSLRVGPVYTVPLPDCGTLVGYTTGTTASPRARVARLDASDQLVTTYDLGAYTVRGLAGEPDGHWAALLWDQAPDPNALHVTRFDPQGTPGWTTPLTDAIGAPTDFGIGESRLEHGAGTYTAYFHVHGISGMFTGHEGDALHRVNAATGMRTLGWSWGCSHSMSELLRHSLAGNATLAACVTDCYPGTSGSNFATSSIGGIYLDHNARKVRDVDAGCNGRVAAELGGLAAGEVGWKLVFNTHQDAAVMGQSSYNTATMNQDIGFVAIANNRQPGATVWLTTTPANEANSSIARWRPDGDVTEQYVVGWSSGTTYYLSRVSAAGALFEGPVAITAAKWGERDDPFREHRNGDIVWAWFDAAGSTTLKVARLRAGGPTQCP